ncbi:MAG: hypothetical protein ABI398_13885 [Devosia sp.]
MADRSPGPVKPPVIDLTARAGARPEAEPRPAADAAPGINHRNDSPPRFRAGSDTPNWPLLGGVAAGGAVLGTILTYLLATLLPLPSHTSPMPPDLTAFVNTQGEQITTLTDSIDTLQNTARKTQVSLDATIAQLDGDMNTVNAALADLKTSQPATQTAVDLTPLETELKTLKSQVDAIAAGASGADAGAIAQSLSDLQTGIGSLSTRLNGVDATITALRTDLDASRKTLSDHINAALPSEIGPAMKLPLILSGLESAFDSGKPFQQELSALASVVPDLAVPETLKVTATSGLTRPDTLNLRFEAALPEILAARDHNSGDWTQNAVDWVKSLLALRPADEEAGDSPEAIVSRLEGAITRHDYAAAIALLAELPAPMQEAAIAVTPDISAHAAADQLVADLRTRALSATTETAQ